MRYDIERDAVLLSVRELCGEATLPEHLDLRSGASHASPERAALGRELHSLLQARAEEGYEAEVSLSHTTVLGGIRYEVSGRADGVLWGERVLVEEIKTVTAKGFERYPDEFHEAQAMCYAHFLCQREGLSEVEVRLTLCRTEDGKTKSFRRVCAADEAESFYLEMLAKIAYRAKDLVERHRVRLPSVRETGKFPYATVREGQDIMIRACYRNIRRGKRLFVQAPTGTGKTVSSLYPAVRALGDGYCDKIFYLTAKASTRREAFAASASLYAAGSRLRTVVLTAREQMCANREAIGDPGGISRHCNPVDCPRAVGFYAKCRAAITALLEEQHGYPRATIEEFAQRFDLCPYELQLTLSEFCDVVICDYNYVFDPAVYLRRYFEGNAPQNGRYVFLIDEAHNLGDRAEDMYSAELKLTDGESVMRAVLATEDAALSERFRPVEEWNMALKGTRRLCRDNLYRDDRGIAHGYYLNPNPMEKLNRAAERCHAFLEKWLFGKRGHPLETEVLRFNGQLKRYCRIVEEYDSRFLSFVEVNGEEITVRQICRDPSGILDRLMKRARSSVLFSATLTPTDYFANILGGGKGAEKIALPSPFDPRRACIVAATGIDTRYESRERSYKKIASHIAATVSAKSGNYIFYFPSYDYLDKVYGIFTEKNPRVETVKQERGMSARAREAFIDAFAEDRKLRVGFCVMGGSFSEGVDLPGNRLIGVGIVGVGLPGISNERNLLREYYDQRGESGYDYAYTYPGMNRVLQAAGRVIRRESDRGIIVLMDSRYAEPRYRVLFPEHWTTVQYAGKATELANIASEFWNNFSDDGKK